MNLKKLASLLLALVLVVALGAAALAETVDMETITVTDNRTYNVYQIFTGDLHEGKLSNVKWGKNGTGTLNELVSEEILNTLTDASDLSAETARLEVIKQYVNLTGEAFGSVSDETALSVPTGYYMLVDKTKLEDGQELSLIVVQVVGPVSVTAKAGQVTSEKKVDDKNDSNTSEDATKWEDSADYDIGDAVPFQLKGTVTSEYDNYKTYYFAFHDNMSAGLTFNADSVKVYVDNTLITEGYSVVTTGLNDGCTFEVVFANLKNISAVKASSVITVEYTATLNDKAKIGAEGNPNTMYLEYSNNPNWTGEGEGSDGKDNDGDGEIDEDDEGDEPTGETPDDTVIVFTYKVVVNKVDQSNAPLTGAGFTLYKKDAATNEYVAVGPELKGEALTTFEWKGLDDGDYKLVESIVPDGYNKIADIEFTITATHDVTSDNPTLTALSGNKITGEATFTASVPDGSLSTDVINKSGAVLPETGGMGTTMLYIVGGLLVAFAVVMLVTKRRMNAAE